MNSVNTIVFDIDDTMTFFSTHSNWIFDNAAKNHPECITQTICNRPRHYIFNPHFEVLIRYLLDQGCQIAIFSRGPEDRNITLMESYLSDEKVLGRQRYEKLKKEGQFKVFSRTHVNAEGKKGLAHILMPDQSIDDIILVDDHHESACVKSGEGTYIPYYFWDYRRDATWPLNYCYCILALFMKYFETAKPSGMTLREYAASIEYVDHPSSPQHYDTKKHAKLPKDVMQLIVQGLREVRKTKPEAKYYPANPKCQLERDLVDPDVSAVAPQSEDEIRTCGDSAGDELQHLKEISSLTYLSYLYDLFSSCPVSNFQAVETHC